MHKVRKSNHPRWKLLGLGLLLLAGISAALIVPRVYNAFSLLHSGQQIDVGGRDMFVRCQGTGAPAIVLEHGLGSSGVEWSDVQQELAEDTRVCFTSRARMGFSDPVPDSQARTAQDAVDDLAAALSGAEISGPYILVGHSFGGFVVRLFANQHPNDVVGVVLVDSAHEDQATALRDALSPSAWSELSGLFDSENPEHMDFQASADEASRAGHLGDLPLIVLEAGQQHTDPGGTVSVETAHQIDQIMIDLWPEYQRDLSTLSHHGTHQLIGDSGHFIQTDRPDAVVDAVRSIMIQTGH